jgi:4-hydroxy-3-polyprenylbenzoate decarboxylase
VAAKLPGFRTLQDFLLALEREGELLRISGEVDPHLEASEIAVRSMREGGPALLFEKIKGSRYPLAMNMLASDRRLQLALGMHPAEIGQQLLHAAEGLMPTKPSRIIKVLKPLASRIYSSRTSKVRGTSSDVASCVTELNELPILQTWPDDAGKFITLPQVVTYDPVSGKRNVGMYRMQVFSAHETGMHWQIQKGGGFHYSVAQQVNRPLEVAVAVGTDPAFLLATVAPLPEGIDEVAFAGFLRGAPTRIRRGNSIGIDVPADAEFLLEGIVIPDSTRLEGPFGDHFGHYSHAGMFPVFEIKSIAHRTNPIFVATVVGKPPMEDKWLGDATQHILGPLAKLMHPEVEDIWAFYEAGFHNLLSVQTTQRYGKEAMKTGLSLVSDNQLSLTKCAILVSKGEENRDFRALLRAISRNFDPHYDFLLLQNVPLDTLDFTSYTMNMGSKMLLDATDKLASTSSGGSYAPRRTSELLDEVGVEQETDVTQLDHRIVDCVLLENVLLVLKISGAYSAVTNAAIHMESEVEIPSKTAGREVLERLSSREGIHKLPKGTKIIAAVSEDVDLRSDLEIIWGIFTRFDAARDICFTRSSMAGISPIHDGVMAIDATWKIGYPNPCEMPEEIRARVRARWKEFGLK